MGFKGSRVWGVLGEREGFGKGFGWFGKFGEEVGEERREDKFGEVWFFLGW